MRFSERMGFRAVKSAIQVDGMDGDLRAGLWNVFRPVFVEPLIASNGQTLQACRTRMRIIWDELLKAPNDEAPAWRDEAHKLLKPLFLEGQYVGVYDLVDFTVRRFGTSLKNLEAQYNPFLSERCQGFDLSMACSRLSAASTSFRQSRMVLLHPSASPGPVPTCGQRSGIYLIVSRRTIATR